jgi:uncharacterized caspase-like protein
VRRAAFVLGNSKYVDDAAFPEIKHCKDDARAVFHLITTPPTGLFEPELSKELINVTVEKVADELALFFEPLSKDDFVFMFFAGHGRSLNQKHLALAMQNTKDGRLTRTALDVNMIGNYLSEKQIRRYALFFDCCRAGAVLDAPGFNSRGKSRKEVKLDYLCGTGRWLVASCQSHENAHEEKTLGHGIFTHFIIQGIRDGKAVSDSAEFVDIHSLCVYTSTSIDELYADLGQEPIFSGGQLKGSPLFIAKNPAFRSNPQNTEFLTEALTRIYTEDDLSDEAKFERARLTRFRQFTERITSDTPSWEELIQLHGQALGIGELAIATEIDAIRGQTQFAAAAARIKHLEPPRPTPQYEPGGVAVIASTSRNEHAYTRAESGSLFAAALERGLRGGAADQNGVVRVRQLFEFIQHVMHVEGEYSQHPLMSMSRATQEDFPITFGAHAGIAAGRRRALVVATDVYSSDWPSLPHNQSSAQAIARVLADAGSFDVSLLLGEDATARSAYATLAAIMHASDASDAVLVYFSGHGVFTRGQDYGLLMRDSELSNPSTVLLVRDLRRALEGGPRNGFTLMFLDASFAGAAADFPLMDPVLGHSIR